MGIKLSDLKNEINKAGTNKSKIFFLKEGSKARVRFLKDLEDGMTIVFHDSFGKNINVPCREQYGKQCQYCDDEELRTRSLYAWSVYDYESKEVKVFLFAVNNCTPVPALTAFYESYGTITDRDYEIKRMGKGTDTAYSVVPLDKMEFRNKKVKPMSEKEILKCIDRAFPVSDEEPDEELPFGDEEEEKPRKKKPAMNKPETEKDDADDWEEEEDKDTNYEDMTPKQLYNLCKEKNIDCEKRMTKEYYIALLEDDDWG